MFSEINQVKKTQRKIYQLISQKKKSKAKQKLELERSKK